MIGDLVQNRTTPNLKNIITKLSKKVRNYLNFRKHNLKVLEDLT